MAVVRLSQILKEERRFYAVEKEDEGPDLNMFEKLPSRMTFVHERLSAFKGERKQDDRCKTKAEQRFSKK